MMAGSGKIYDGKTLIEWENKWKSIGPLASKGWQNIRDIGIYRFSLRGKVVYIGRVIHKKGKQGFHWRLQQYDSGSPAGNTTPSAKKIHKNRQQLHIHIICMDTIQATKALEKALIEKYSPPWNSHFTS